MLTVLEPAVSRRLTTAENVRTDLGLPNGSPSDDQINRLIDQASAMVVDFCRREFVQEKVRQRTEACGDEVLLERAPATQVTLVRAGDQILSDDDYEVGEYSIRRLSNGCSAGLAGGCVTLEYLGGYVLEGEGPKIPPAVERAVIQLVAAAISGASRDPLIKSEDVDGLGSISYWVPGARTALPSPEAEQLLKPYRSFFGAV